MTLAAADRLAILEVITRADEAASRRDADGYVALFAPDAVLDGTQGRHDGREELRASVGPIWAAEGPATVHLTLNPVIEPGLMDPAHRRAPPASRPGRRPARPRIRRSIRALLSSHINRPAIELVSR